MLKVTYLHHSGFLVETDKYYMIFDYYTESGRYDLIEPEKLTDKTVLVFVSHFHQDHFDKIIFTWRDKIKDIHYILSEDIKRSLQWNGDDIEIIHTNHKKYTMFGVTIKALRSTDSGVAYCVFADGAVIYHGGDLHWWHWNGESEGFNKSMAGMYKKEISKLFDIEIDVAFIPLDLRLEDKYLLGMDYIMKNTKIKHAFPMHFWNDYSVFERMASDELSVAYRNRVHKITTHGEEFLIEN